MFLNTPKRQNNDFFKPQNHTYNDITNIISNHLNVTQCRCKSFDTPSIFVHGSAGDFNDVLIIEKMISCKKAASTGYQSLLNGASPVEAVETALWWLECDELFNCGYGALLNEIGINVFVFPRLCNLAMQP